MWIEVSRGYVNLSHAAFVTKHADGAGVVVLATGSQQPYIAEDFAKIVAAIAGQCREKQPRIPPDQRPSPADLTGPSIHL